MLRSYPAAERFGDKNCATSLNGVRENYDTVTAVVLTGLFLMNAVASSLVNGLLKVKPLANFAKYRARKMMIERAETIGVYWRDEVKALRARDSVVADDVGPNGVALNPIWEHDLAALTNPSVVYPSYYTTSFHAYEEGNLGWLPALEVDVAARAVHARIWPQADDRSGIEGDRQLRKSYHQALKDTLAAQKAPARIIDLGASTGRSTFALQESFPSAQITGVDLSPYFLAVAQHAEQRQERPLAATSSISWVHAPAEATGLPAESAELVSACLVFHELPVAAARDIVAEAYRLLSPGGHFAIMDMNPQSEIFAKMPPYILTLLKSTEPYLDQYFALDMSELLIQAGFLAPRIVCNTPRHRTIMGQKPMI